MPPASLSANSPDWKKKNQWKPETDGKWLLSESGKMDDDNGFPSGKTHAMPLLAKVISTDTLRAFRLNASTPSRCEPDADNSHIFARGAFITHA